MTTFLFLRITLDLSFESGDARRAAHSSVRSFSAPLPVPPACAGLPDVDTESNRPTRTLECFRIERGVENDVHGSLDRAKDVSSNMQSAL